MIAGAGPAAALGAFRREPYASLRRRADALFELCDAMLTAGTVSSPVHLTLASAHRRLSGRAKRYPAVKKAA